jgi:hypothetical protein
MVKVLFLFPKTADGNELDDAAKSVIEGLKTQPTVRSISGSTGHLMGGRDIPYSRVMEASFDSLGDVMAYLDTPRGNADKEAGKRLGVVTLLYETAEL